MKIPGCLFLLQFLALSDCGRFLTHVVSDGACGGVPERYTATRGSIYGPMAQDWMEMLNCTWIIEASAREPITISFEAFTLDCYVGLLTISTSGQTPRRLCGWIRPQPLTFTGGNVYLHFQSGYSTRSGFQLSYVKGSPCQAGHVRCWTGQCLPPSARCAPRTPPSPPLSCGRRKLSGFYGSFSSPDYGGGRGQDRPPYNCSWRIDTGDRRPLLLRFPGLALGRGDWLAVYDGTREAPRQLVANLSHPDNGEGGRAGAPSLRTSAGAALVRYRSRGTGSGGFNATYQVRGYCLPWENPCLDGGPPSCYSPSQRCDGSWDCRDGRDEEGCEQCPDGRYPCGGRSEACYSPADRCNYQTNCPGGGDERGCRVCQPGTFHCTDDRCVFETWACDGQPDCADGSDERDCARALPRKVATAAVVGSLVCGLLLVIAMGCTCKLYSLRTSEYSLFTPLARMEAQMVQRRAPPSYGQLIAQGAIAPVEDFPTENPNDTSVIGNLRSILQLLRQGSPPRSSRRRRRNRYVRRLSRRFRRSRLYALLTRSPSAGGAAEAAAPSAGSPGEGEADRGVTGTDSVPPSSAPPLPRKFPLLEGAPSPSRAEEGMAAAAFLGRGGARRGEGDGGAAGERDDVLLLPLADCTGRGEGEGDEEALLP